MSKADQIRALRERQYEEQNKRFAQSAANKSPAAFALTTMVAVVNNVINSVAKTGTERQAKWRASNLETNRQRARDGMRKRRAEQNAT